MGGTFDPIHHGHLVAASEVQAWFDLDEVVFVPTGQPWQKSERDVSPGRGPLPDDGHRDRVQPPLLGSAASTSTGTARRTPIDTLRDLSEQLPDADLYFITGADALGEILTWRDAEELFELAHFVGCTRPGYEMEPPRCEGIPHDRVTIVEIPALAISSTDVPRAPGSGEPVWYLVPDGVVQYIDKHCPLPLTRARATPR